MKKIDYEKYKCAIFDLDGTLIDSTGVWAEVDVKFLRKRGIERADDFINEIKTHTFTSGSEYVVKRFNLNEKPEDIAKEWFDMAADAYANDILLKNGVYEYLKLLKKKEYKIGLATSSDRALYEKCLKRNGIYDYFDAFTQTDEVSRGKKFPDVYIRAAEKLGMNPDECIVFEDVYMAVKSAISGGFFTVAVMDESSEADWEKIKNTADITICDYDSLLDGE